MTVRTKDILIGLVIGAAVGAGLLFIMATVSGCDTPVGGLRLAPGEEQKQLSHAGAELAMVANSLGLPPRSAATRHLATAARTGATYTGAPKEPINITDLIPSSVANSWSNLIKRAEAMRLKREIQAKASEMVAADLSDLLTTVQDQAEVAVAGLIHRVRALVSVVNMAEQIAASIPIPDDDKISDAERERLLALDKTLKRIEAAATAQAARRPTIEEVADKATATADTVIGKVGGLLESYGLLALIPGAAGVYYGARKRKQAREAEAEKKIAAGTAEKVIDRLAATTLGSTKSE